MERTLERGPSWRRLDNSCENTSQNIRFVAKWRKWLYWSGARRGLDESGYDVGLARQTFHAGWRQTIADIQAGGDVREIIGHCKSMSTLKGLNAIVALASSEIGITTSHDDLDSDPLLLGFDNGVLDLRSGELRTGNKNDYVTMSVGYDYDPIAKCPTWESFLASTFGGDQELIDYLQSLCGYILTGLTDRHDLPVLHGTGANGKSTFVEVLLAVMGDYGATANPSLMVVAAGTDHLRPSVPIPTLARCVMGRHVIHS